MQTPPVKYVSECLAIWKKDKTSPWTELHLWDQEFQDTVGRLLEKGYPAEFIFDEDVTMKLNETLILEYVENATRFPTTVTGKVYSKKGWVNAFVTIDLHLQTYFERKKYANPQVEFFVTRMILTDKLAL